MSASAHHKTQSRRGLLRLAVIAPLVGALTGCVGAAFRLSLDRASVVRDLLVNWAHGQGFSGFAILASAAALATFVAAWLVRRLSPHASGSGIPHVEAVLRGEIQPAPFALLPVKFVGGVLAIGAGLALGREGPSVQMGASIAIYVARLFRIPWSDCRVLLAAGAGAGLAMAFNAPIAGAVFVLEELVQRFEQRIAIAALAASGTAIVVGRALLGDAPDFSVPPMESVGILVQPLFFALGAVQALLAVAYNRALLVTMSWVGRWRLLPIEARAGVIGAVVGVLAWFTPDLVGGGDSLTQRTLTGHDPLAFVCAALVIRFALGALSYAAATPGGLFAPLLVLGAQSGLLFGAACQAAWPGVGVDPEAFAVVGMAGFFVGVVRAPATGIVLVTEMTGDANALLPMLGASFAAMLVPTLLRAAPIYDSLRELTLRRERSATAAVSPPT